MRILLSLFVILLLAACGAQATPVPTPRPSATPTPLSTALPPVDTPISLGSNARPYRLVILSSDKTLSGSKLADFLSAQLSATFLVEFVNDEAAALTQLCSEKPSAAIMDGRSALAGLAQGCGALAFKLQDANGGFGVKSDVFAHIGTLDKNPPRSVADLRGKDFCRLTGGDLTSWMLPALALRAGGVNPAVDLKGVKEFDTPEKLVQAVADGLCAAGGLPAGTLSNYKPTLRDAELRLLTTTPEYPNGGMVISTTIPKALADALIDLIRKNPDQFEPLLGGSKLVEAKADDFAGFTQFAQSAGLNLKTIGE